MDDNQLRRKRAPAWPSHPKGEGDSAPNRREPAFSLGFVGVGHLASYTIAGLRRAGYAGSIALSPRNRENSDRLAHSHDCAVLSSNQAVADASEIIVISAGPDAAPGICDALEFRPNQLVIFASTGLPLAAIARSVAPATAVRAMIIAGAAVCEGPISIYPDEPRARKLLGRLGAVVPFSDEHGFRAAARSVVAFSWLLALADRLIAFDVAAGLSTATARRLVLDTMRAAAALAADGPDVNICEIADSIAREGTYSRVGLNELLRQGGLDGWLAAREAVDNVAHSGRF